MTQATTSLQHRGNLLSDPNQQLVVLSPMDSHPKFSDKLRDVGLNRLKADRIEILQVNLGKLCNMTCAHCHVDAGPDRREIMQRPTIDACLEAMRKEPEIKTLDQLPKGRLAVVIDVMGDDPIARRLGDLGVRKGVQVEVIRQAPLGDPTVYELCNYQLCLRRSESARIQVSVWSSS